MDSLLLGVLAFISGVIGLTLLFIKKRKGHRGP
jgi:hypothetical protein